MNFVALLSSIFKYQDTDTLNHVVTELVDDGLFAQVETRPHDDGVVMTILIRDEETGEEKDRHRLLITATEFSS